MKEATRLRQIHNETLPCLNPECSNRRTGLSRYCKSCQPLARRRRMYGWPQGAPIHRQELEPYVKRAKAFILRNITHDAIIQTTEWIDAWLKAAAQGLKCKCPDQIALLYDIGVSGTDLLATTIATLLFSNERPVRLPKENRYALELALGRAWIKHPPTRRVNGRGAISRGSTETGAYIHSIRVIGREALTNVGPLAFKIIYEMQMEHDREMRRIEALQKPFKF